MNRPNVSDFHKAAPFLKSMYLYHYHRDRKMSLRRLAMKCKLASSGYLSMVLNGQRRISLELLSRLCKELKVKAHEKRYLIKLMELGHAKQDVQEDSFVYNLIDLAKHVYEFSPLFFGAKNVQTDIPAAWAEKLSGYTYWILGKTRDWNHLFYLQKDVLAVSRTHSNRDGKIYPSRSTQHIRFFSKELLKVEHDWLFIFWPEPTPQFHSFALSEELLNGRVVIGSMSGVNYEYRLEKKSSDPKKILHHLDHEDRWPNGK